MHGNPLCGVASLALFCESEIAIVNQVGISQTVNGCPPQSCPTPYKYVPASPVSCFCAAPLLVGYRLKSPGFIEFEPYINQFGEYLSSGLNLHLYQLDIGSPEWEEGPRLRMLLNLFPAYIDENSFTFNKTEVVRIRSMLTGWKIPSNDIFGPYELLKFTLLDPYKDVIVSSSSSGVSKGAVAGIVVGVIALSLTFSAFLILRLNNGRGASKMRQQSTLLIKIDGVKEFGFKELAMATNHFDSSSIIGQGGYGKVYKGVRSDGTVVAIKRAQEGSLQGEKEFLTEIELLSRLHHRNLVSLIGYCVDDEEQMLIYEYMANGTLRDHISGKCKDPLSFAMRLRIAMGSAKGILYLHSEADPPIFHRDIKATNILLDARFTAKVADFGLSSLAPVPDLEGVVPAHVSTVVKGTPGYLDPEYFATYKYTDKSDVYSLGVVFLELLTGMPAISHGNNIVRVVRSASVSGKIFSLIDDKMGSYPSESVQKFLTLALKCCLDESESRPSMAEVVHELEKLWSMMPEFDTKQVDTMATDHKKVINSSSSFSTIRHPFVSSDISGIDLLLEVTPR